VPGDWKMLNALRVRFQSGPENGPLIRKPFFGSPGPPMKSSRQIRLSVPLLLRFSTVQSQ
jgi:hypothetical protein